MDVQNLEKNQRNKIIKELCDQGAGFSGHQLRDYSKSSNRSENRPLIYEWAIIQGWFLELIHFIISTEALSI